MKDTIQDNTTVFLSRWLTGRRFDATIRTLCSNNSMNIENWQSEGNGNNCQTHSWITQIEDKRRKRSLFTTKSESCWKMHVLPLVSTLKLSKNRNFYNNSFLGNVDWDRTSRCVDFSHRSSLRNSLLSCHKLTKTTEANNVHTRQTLQSMFNVDERSAKGYLVRIAQKPLPVESRNSSPHLSLLSSLSSRALSFQRNMTCVQDWLENWTLEDGRRKDRVTFLNREEGLWRWIRMFIQAKSILFLSWCCISSTDYRRGGFSQEKTVIEKDRECVWKFFTTYSCLQFLFHRSNERNLLSHFLRGKFSFSLCGRRWRGKDEFFHATGTVDERGSWVTCNIRFPHKISQSSV